jgi:hypothetical protein
MFVFVLVLVLVVGDNEVTNMVMFGECLDMTEKVGGTLSEQTC